MSVDHYLCASLDQTKFNCREMIYLGDESNLREGRPDSLIFTLRFVGKNFLKVDENIINQISEFYEYPNVVSHKSTSKDKVLEFLVRNLGCYLFTDTY